MGQQVTIALEKDEWETVEVSLLILICQATRHAADREISPTVRAQRRHYRDRLDAIREGILSQLPVWPAA